MDKLKREVCMGRVIPFPSERARQGYDPNAIRYLRLGPPRPPQVTMLGECAISDAEQRLLVGLLQENAELWSVRLLDREGNEVIAFTGDLPPCRIVLAAENARTKQGIRLVDTSMHLDGDEE